MGREVCAAWADSSKLCNAGDGTTTDCVDGAVPVTYRWTDDDYLLAASNILHARTCRRYPGACGPFEVWPCIDSRCYSNEHPCAPCIRYDVIALPTDLQVLEIVSVTEDGVPLPDTAYRLEGRNRVVRIDGQRWQRNSFGVAGASGVETVVTFTAGALPPIELQQAAADLADELKKACAGNSCAIDARVRSLSRRGVEIELTDLAELLKSGATGITSVDYALSVHGDCAQGGATIFDPSAKATGIRKV